MATTPTPGDRPARRRLPLKRIALVGGLGLIALLLVIQLVPYGRDHTNPPVTRAAKLDARTQQIVTSACADCHSNLTRWPWYTNVAPASWFAQSDVDGGRSILNFSRWDTPQPSVDELAEVIADGEMPPLKYKILPNHADARLSDAEKRDLIAGLRRLYATDPPAAIKEIGTQRRQ
ncbi:unannotated protein [freshwater metagenome]|uniref:Unannotated protein n=1 Tax=freshwater metagenome TaxID=449393 RepID=A0A6J7GYG9_9ZZZZ